MHGPPPPPDGATAIGEQLDVLLDAALAEAAAARSAAEIEETQMLAEGIDPTDEDALATWITSFNARPRGERDSVIGETRPELRLHLRMGRPPQAPHAPAGAKRAPKARRRAARVARKANRR